MTPKIVLLDDDPREILVFRQIFSHEHSYVLSPFSQWKSQVEVGESLLLNEKITVKGFDLFEASDIEQAVTFVRESLSDDVPVSIVFISINHHRTQERIACAQQLREIDPRIYLVILTDANGENFKQQLQKLGATALILKKPFEVEEVRQLTLHFVQSWQKDLSLSRLQDKLKNRVLENLFEASMYGLLNPILLSISDKVNSQNGLLSYLNENAVAITENKKKLKDITLHLLEDSADLSKTVIGVQQLFSSWDEVAVFTAKSVRARIFNLIPELQNLPDDIEFHTKLNVPEDVSLALPINLLILTIASLIRNALESVNRHLLNSGEAGDKGQVWLKSEVLNQEKLHLSIEDNGEGFDAASFDSIDQVKLAGYKQYSEHTDMRLAIVKAFIDSVHGTFSMSSEGKGKGEKVELTFPLTIHQVS